MINLFNLISKDSDEFKKLGIHYIIKTYEEIDKVIKKGCEIKASDGEYVYFDNYKEFNHSFKFFHIDYDIYDYVRKLVIR